MNNSLSYCDYIAHTVLNPALEADAKDNCGTLSGVGRINMDLAKEGWMQTTTRTIEITDVNGREYRVTIEDITK